MSQVIAVLCSDIHLSLAAPVARSAEPDWLAAQARPLDQIRKLVKEHGNVPVVCAGDVFDKWHSSPELINWTITHLPKMYAIPGQHDLPLHNIEDIRRSAYWTLVEVGTIRTIEEPWDEGIDGVLMFGYPWGSAIEPILPKKNKVQLAVIHDYVFIRGKSYPGAPDGANLVNHRSRLQGYNAAVFGDNHDGFLTKVGGTSVLNCGCLVRRKSDERKYKPAVGLLHNDGLIEQHFLDASEDKWLEPEEIIERVEAPGMTEFLEELNQLESDSLDFCEVIRRYIKDNHVSDGVKRVLLETIGG